MGLKHFLKSLNKLVVPKKQKSSKSGVSISIPSIDDNSIDNSNTSLAQWSAILDNEACPLCKLLDMKVVKYGSKTFKKYKNWPGKVHKGCRCVWIYIMKGEVDPPKVDWPSDEEIEKLRGNV